MIKVHTISREMFDNFSKLQGWEVTKIKKGEAVQTHKHSFDAMYFVHNVKNLFSSGKISTLPEFAAVFIPKGVEHGWSDSESVGAVGHFHSGHGTHAIVSSC